MLTIPSYPRRLSLITVLFGMFLFVWMSAEDSVWLVSVFGLGLSLLCAVHGVFRLKGRTFTPRLWIPAAVGLGAGVGVGAALLTILLMVMKTSLHNHIYPDYPFPLISGIASRLGPWALAGALVGLALALILYRAPRDSSDR